MDRVLLTGGCGFVGQGVLDFFLTYTDWEVVVLDRLNYASDIHNIIDNPCVRDNSDRVSFVYHDLKYKMPGSIVKKLGSFEYIVHLAANSHVDNSIQSPVIFFQDNVIGTVNLLEYVREFSPDARVINFGTDEVFGPAPDAYDFKEDDRWRPSNPYSASKCGQLAAGISYHVTYGLDIITTYTMNIFGPNQYPEKLIPKAIELAKRRKLMPVFSEIDNAGNLQAIGKRHWLYIENVGDAIVFILKNGMSGEHYNIVGTDELSNEEVVNIINGELGYEPLIEYVDFHKTRPGHDRRYALDGAKIEALGWTPQVSFKEGIRRILQEKGDIA